MAVQVVKVTILDVVLPVNSFPIIKGSVYLSAGFAGGKQYCN
jgi:hypothetical protein